MNADERRLNLLTERIIGCCYTVANALGHLAQCMNYLRAAELPICLLVNFGTPKVLIRRVINSAYLRSSAFICGSQ